MRLKWMLMLTVVALPSAIPTNAQSSDATENRNGAIIVSGSREERSSWREAETDHAVIYSNGSEKELTEVARNIEKLHFLLSLLTNKIGREKDIIKLKLYLVSNGDELDAMDLRNTRSAEGPFASIFPPSRYYDPREDGPVMAITRADQKITLERGVAISSLGDIITNPQNAPTAIGPANGASSTSAGPQVGFTTSGQLDGAAANEEAFIISPNARLYGSYAQHFLVSQFPAAYPRWYVEGFGQVFATVDADKEGMIEYGRHPEGYRAITDRFRRYPIAKILDGTYLGEAESRTRWTPASAWLLTHYLLFSERRGQLNAYLLAIKQGKSLAEAAGAFGDIAQLERDIAAYYSAKRFPYEQMTYPAERIAQPSLRSLTKGEAAFVKGRLELASRIEIPALAPAGPDAKLASKASKVQSAALKTRDAWLADLRRDAGRYGTNLQAQLLLAEAECRSDQYAGCNAAADRALALAPQNSDALVWKGTAQVQMGLALPEQSRAGAVRAGRATIAKANRQSPDAPLPLLAYYRSFSATETAAPDVAVAGLMKAVEAVPQAPKPRVELATALAARDLGDDARAALLPVANGAFDSPERGDAAKLLSNLPSSTEE